MSPSQFAQRLREPVRPHRIVLTLTTTTLLAAAVATAKAMPLIFTTASRFEADSIRQAAQLERIETTLKDMNEREMRMDDRLGEVWCKEIQQKRSEGCR